ncbi:MAG: ribonuclease III domain-containing protein, partial [Pirellulales bacterium]
MSDVLPVAAGATSAEALERCEERLGYRFNDRSLLTAALTHASGAQHRLLSNERLEFLGDAILGAVVCEVLFHRYPEYLEGDLTRIKSVVVSRRTCAKISKSLELQEFLILGKGMATSPTVPPSLLADVFESLLAAIYLDGGSQAARDFIIGNMGPEIDDVAADSHGGNFKSLLQQHAQREDIPTVRPESLATLYPLELRRAGYRTAHFGKWHFRAPAGFQPASQYDEFEAIGRNPYFRPLPDGTRRHETDLVADRGIAFLRAQPKNRPFALNLWFNAAHAEDNDRRPGSGHYPWPPSVDGLYEDRAIPPPRLSDSGLYEAH